MPLIKKHLGTIDYLILLQPLNKQKKLSNE